MLNKTLLMDAEKSSVSKDLVVKMGYGAIQRQKSKCLYEIEYFDSEKPVQNLFCVASDRDLRDLQLAYVAHGERLWVELIVTSKLTEKAIFEVYKLTKGKSTFLTFPFEFRKNRVLYSPKRAKCLIDKLRGSWGDVGPRSDVCAPNLSMMGQRFNEFGFRVLSEAREVSKSEPEFSVVIPVYNNLKFAYHTLKNLDEVYEGDSCFEVIVVDDGSSDGFSELIISKENEFSFPMTLICNPRERERVMGDFAYRAGLSRNIGAGYARGKNLLFLDCDILVPRNTFKNLRAELEASDLVMFRREHLRPEHSARLPSYCADNEKHIIDSDYGYWWAFYRNANDWDGMVDKWRYVCTHGLGISKDLFQAIGGLSNNYNVYGYEDVELGFRVAKKGGRFKLSQNVTYHLSPPVGRSEFARQHHKKMKLLSYSSKVFYFNTLDEAVFDHAKIFWSTSNFKFFMYGLKRKMGF